MKNIIAIISIFLFTTFSYAKVGNEQITLMLDSLKLVSANESKSLNNRIALYYYSQSERAKALQHWNQVLKQAKIENDSLWIANSSYNVGLIYSALNEPKKSIEYNKKALAIYEAMNNKSGQAASCNVFGLIYYNQKNYVKALEYFQKCEQLSKDINDIKGLSGAHSNTGLIYLSKEKYDEALISFKKAEKILTNNNMENNLASIISNIGLVYFEQNKYNKALEYFQKSYEIKKEIGNKIGIASTLNNMGAVYVNINKLTKGESLLLEAQQIAIQINDLDALYNNYLNYYELNIQKENFTEAISYLNKSIKIKDQIYQDNTNNLVLEMQVKFDIERKEQEIALLKNTKNIQDLQITNQKNAIVSLVILLAIFIISLIIIIKIYLEKLQSNRELVKKNLEIVASEKQLLVSNEKYKGSKLSATEKQKIADKINEIFIIDKPYLATDFNSNQLAQLLNINKSYLSEVINDVLHKNFNSLINEYRIKEARRLFSEPDIDKYTIEHISEKVGFSSISTFNRAFKKQLGITPSFYLSTIANKGF